MTNKAARANANLAKNRLLITVPGNLSKANLDNLYTEVRFCVTDLTPGFDVITDLSDCSMAALSGVSTFKKIINYLIENKVGRVVRVIRKDRVILKQLLNLSAKIQGYKAEYFPTLAEAEAALSNSVEQDALRFVLHEQSVKFTLGRLEGSGLIKDMSTSGCSINTDDQLPFVEDELSISIEFKKHANMLNLLEIKGIVTWVKDNKFGLNFNTMDFKQQDQLWERLVYESKCEIS